MQKIKEAIGTLLKWIGAAIAQEITKCLKDQISEQSGKIDALGQRVSALHESDSAALECDLSLMDDRICTLIDQCRAKRYRTAGDWRRVKRLHEAYKARGGNHGEEIEYEIFCQLPTEEEFLKTKGE